MEFEGVVVVRDNVRVTLNWIGEGVNGDYDDSDPNDEPLLRFDVDKFEEGEWTSVDDASYCTNLNAELSIEVLGAAANYILGVIYDSVVAGYNVRHMPVLEV